MYNATYNHLLEDCTFLDRNASTYPLQIKGIQADHFSPCERLILHVH